MKRTIDAIAFALLACMLTVAAGAQQAVPAEKPLAHTYRLTYTLTTTEGGKVIGDQHFFMTVSAPTNHGSIKMGEKVPIATGSSNDGKSGRQTEITYLDIGISIDATVAEDASGIELTSKVEQSSVAPVPVKIDDVSEPLIRQMVLSNTSQIVPGKTVSLGSLDVPDTTRHIEIAVMAEQLP